VIVTRPDTRDISRCQSKQHVDRSCRFLLSWIKAVSVTRDSNCKRKTQTRVPSYPYHRQPCRNSNNILKSTRIRFLAIWDEDRLGKLSWKQRILPLLFPVLNTTYTATASRYERNRTFSNSLELSIFST